MSARALTATRMAFRDQLRRPLVLILLVLVPAYVITRSIAETLPTPRRIGLPDGVWVTTTMKDLHGAGMGGLAIGFCRGAWLVSSSCSPPSRGTGAWSSPASARARRWSPRLLVLGAATALVVTVAAVTTALNFSPASWLPFLAALALLGLIYGATRRSRRRRPRQAGGHLSDPLPGHGRRRCGANTDVPRDARPSGAWLLPSYGPSRVMYEGAFSEHFHAMGALAIGLGWLAVLGACRLHRPPAGRRTSRLTGITRPPLRRAGARQGSRLPINEASSCRSLARRTEPIAVGAANRVAPLVHRNPGRPVLSHSYSFPDATIPDDSVMRLVVTSCHRVAIWNSGTPVRKRRTPHCRATSPDSSAG